MKKLVLITLLAISSLLIAGMAYADNTLLGGTAGTSTTFGGGIYKPSTNVTVCVSSLNNLYTAASLHSGAIAQTAGKEYYTLSSSPQIFSATNPASMPTCPGPGAIPTTTGDPWQ